MRIIYVIKGEVVELSNNCKVMMRYRIIQHTLNSVVLIFVVVRLWGAHINNIFSYDVPLSLRCIRSCNCFILAACK